MLDAKYAERVWFIAHQSLAIVLPKDRGAFRNTEEFLLP